MNTSSDWQWQSSHYLGRASLGNSAWGEYEDYGTCIVVNGAEPPDSNPSQPLILANLLVLEDAVCMWGPQTTVANKYAPLPSRNQHGVSSAIHLTGAWRCHRPDVLACGMQTLATSHVQLHGSISCRPHARRYRQDSCQHYRIVACME